MVTPIELIQAVIDGMAERGFGRIVNITSLSVYMPIAGLDLSSGARAGLTSFLAGVARTVADNNVTINHMLPGKLDTDRLRGPHEPGSVEEPGGKSGAASPACRPTFRPSGSARRRSSARSAPSCARCMPAISPARTSGRRRALCQRILSCSLNSFSQPIAPSVWNRVVFARRVRSPAFAMLTVSQIRPRVLERPDAQRDRWEAGWKRTKRKTPASISTRLRSSSTSTRCRESSRSRRPSRSATSATWRSPIRPASPHPAWPSATTRTLAADYTARANLVGVISNGSAVLGLGNIGPLASKPVMEGKAVLFKKFAGIDVFDIEIDAPDIERMVSTVSALEPTFGGINLEDIKAPECFEVEERLKAKMGIPVFHDDQHGTAIIVAAAVLNGLEFAGKTIDDIKIVTSGAGAAALACLNLLVSLGAKVENIWVTDRFGVAYKGRVDEMDRWKDPYVKDTPARTLADVIPGADVFLGLSAAGVLSPDLLKHMAEKPLILALANPTPEIMPEIARQARPDAMICTGRSDFPNQVNNVLCFPYIFRGALDCGARAINEEMKMAAVRAIAALAREEPSDVAARAYAGETPTFGPDFLIPSPFDPRLILRIAPAVAKAACESGVATRPIADFDAYVDKLNRFVFRSGLVMKPVFSIAKGAQAKRVIYADGEDERVLRAAQVVLEEGIAEPILIGRPHVVDVRLKRYGLRIRPGTDFELINPEDDPRYRDYVDLLIELAGRRGVTQEAARIMVRTEPDGDRRACAEARRRRRDDLRAGRPLRAPSAQRHADHRPRAPACATATSRRCRC